MRVWRPRRRGERPARIAESPPRQPIGAKNTLQPSKP
jgi:hypothetical protein